VKIIANTILAILLLVSSSFAALKPNDNAPAFSLRDSAGNDFYLNDVIGAKNKEQVNGVILSFFASWCIPCRNELPMINSLADEMRNKGVKVVIVGVREDFTSINALLTNLKVDKPVVLSDRNGKVSEEYQVRFLPVTFFIGNDGKVKDVIYGEIGSAQALRNSAGKLLR
jgi:thiol-disulfide isomerase/thioredoxin